MNWQDLNFFCAFARSGSLSAAAREFGVDHVTVGRRIAALEHDVGLRLVDRLPRSTVLTAAGRAFAAQAGLMADHAHTLARQAREISSQALCTVRISAPPAVATYVIAPHVAAFCQQHQHITLVLSGLATLAALDRGEADVALRMSRPGEADLIAQRVGVMRYGLYARPDYAQRAADTWQFVGYDPSLEQTTQQRWMRSLANGRRIVFQATDLRAQIEAAHGGLGVVALPQFMGEPDQQLQRLSTALPAPEVSIWLTTYPDLSRAPAIRAVMDFLAKVIGDTCPVDEK